MPGCAAKIPDLRPPRQIPCGLLYGRYRAAWVRRQRNRLFGPEKCSEASRLHPRTIPLFSDSNCRKEALPPDRIQPTCSAESPRAFLRAPLGPHPKGARLRRRITERTGLAHGPGGSSCLIGLTHGVRHLAGFSHGFQETETHTAKDAPEQIARGAALPLSSDGKTVRGTRLFSGVEIISSGESHGVGETPTGLETRSARISL